MKIKLTKKLIAIITLSGIIFTGAVFVLGGYGASGPSSAPNLAEYGLVGYWNMEEGKGQTVYDRSGNGNNGTLGGTTAVQKSDPVFTSGYSSAGAGGTALKFDGVNDYVNLGQPATLLEKANYTFIAWFKVGQDINGNSGIQNLINRGSRSDILFGVADSVGTDGDLSLHYYDYSLSFHALSVGQTVWSQNDWHMVTATKDSTIGHKIYLDGILKNSDSNTSDDNLASRNISIGAAGWVPSRYFNGSIDEVRIYNRALSADEIRQHYNQKKPILEMKFDEGSGTTTKDESFNNNDITFPTATTNQPAWSNP